MFALDESVELIDGGMCNGSQLQPPPPPPASNKMHMLHMETAQRLLHIHNNRPLADTTSIVFTVNISSPLWYTISLSYNIMKSVLYTTSVCLLHTASLPYTP